MGQSEKTPIRILIVDNDEKILSILQEYLELSHYHVRTAVSGLGLIEIARKEFPKLPIIAMTGYGKQVRNLTSEQSPDDYLEKPFNLEALSKAVESLLHRG